MIKSKTNDKYIELTSKLAIDCKKCSGLCCVALCYMKVDGFPSNKPAGKPCGNLMPDFRCAIHPQLVQANMKGCLAYDCFGAGQKVTQICFPDSDWKNSPKKASDIFEVFLILFRLHQLLWYLLEALSLVAAEQLASDIEALIIDNEQMTALSPVEILNLDVEKYKIKVNQVLRKVSEMICVNPNGKQIKEFSGKNFKKSTLDCRDFSMSFMIGANLEGCSLRGTNFLGADMRDTNIKNTDLSESIFLTQMQINSARGNSNTKLPAHLSRPTTW